MARRASNVELLFAALPAIQELRRPLDDLKVQLSSTHGREVRHGRSLQRRWEPRVRRSNTG